MSLTLEHITRIVDGVPFISDANITFEPGSFNVLLGRTLAGKTSLMRLMAGLDKPTEGRVLMDGADVTSIPVQQRNISMVYQQFINYPNMTVYENIASPLRVVRTSATRIKEKVGQVAELMRLTPMLDRMPNELSGGQQQRTALARALVKSADLVLLDEPLANLDYKLREELREELPKLFQGTDATVVYATTEPMEALLLGGHTATLSEGRVTQYGPTAELYHSPRELITAQVFSDPPINTSRISKRGGRFYLAESVSWPVPERIAGLADGDYTIGFRPHHINLHPLGERALEVEGRVMITEISGSESVVHVQVAGSTWVSLSHGIHLYQVGDMARLYLQTDRCFYFDSDLQRIET
jgi:glycerol transport system ATP-binding protein